jgi:hypothetical protein
VGLRAPPGGLLLSAAVSSAVQGEPALRQTLACCLRRPQHAAPTLLARAIEFVAVRGPCRDDAVASPAGTGHGGAAPDWVCACPMGRHARRQIGCRDRFPARCASLGTGVPGGRARADAPAPNWGGVRPASWHKRAVRTAQLCTAAGSSRRRWHTCLTAARCTGAAAGRPASTIPVMPGIRAQRRRRARETAARQLPPLKAARRRAGAACTAGGTA